MSEGTWRTANSLLCLVAHSSFQLLSRLLQLARWLRQQLHLLGSFLVWFALCVVQTINCSLALPIHLLQGPINMQKWSKDQEKRKLPNARSNHPRVWLSSILTTYHPTKNSPSEICGNQFLQLTQNQQQQIVLLFKEIIARRNIL